MSRKPPPAGFRFRPRSRPYRIMLWLLAAQQVLVTLVLAWLGWSWWQDSFVDPRPLVVSALLMPLFLSFNLHANWGAKGGEVPTPLQLRQWPELRNLPELPPLRPAQLLAVYTLPTLLAGGLFYGAGLNEMWQSMQRLSSPEHMTARWSGGGWVQVSCAEVPLSGKTDQSLCFALLKNVGGAPFEAELYGWLQGRYTTFSPGENAFRRETKPLPKLDTVYGGGILSGAADLVIPHDSAFGQKTYAYRLRFLGRDSQAQDSQAQDSQAQGKPLAPGISQADAEWIERQPFSGIIMLTPQ